MKSVFLEDRKVFISFPNRFLFPEMYLYLTIMGSGSQLFVILYMFLLVVSPEFVPFSFKVNLCNCNNLYLITQTLKTSNVYTYTRVGIKPWQLCFGKIDRSWRNVEIYIWKWMVLGALGCVNNANLGENSKLFILNILNIF